jgi:hypothetical protein
MNNWNQLLLTLDKTIGFPNKISSTVKKRWQGYDLWKNEHVIWLEYRVKVNPGIHPPQRPAQNLRDVRRDPVSEGESMAMIRELMDGRFVHTVDSSPSSQSPKPDKKKTAKSSVVPKKLRPKPPASPIKPA